MCSSCRGRWRRPRRLPRSPSSQAAPARPGRASSGSSLISPFFPVLGRAPFTWWRVNQEILSAYFAHSLTKRQPIQSLHEARPVRERQLGVELEQRDEDEAAGGDLPVREGEAVVADLDLAEEEQVDVEG